MPAAKLLRLRLLLEGEEVPVISAQVMINIGAPATASIQIIPLDSALDFFPRTMVHLFFLDVQGVGEEQTSEYKLLFAGEVVGFAYSQTPASRGTVLQCLDFSNYWDSCNAMAVSYGPGGNAFTNDGSINGASIGMFTDIPGDSAAEHLVRWVRSPPVTAGLTGVSGLAGGIIHIMEAMGGVPGHFKGINDFYTVAELRCRLMNQITAEENDSTASRVLSIKVFEEWLKGGLQQAGGNITFRDIMNLLFSHIFYEFVPNPAPKFDNGNGSKSTKTNSIALTSNSKVAGIRTRLDEMRMSLILLNGQITLMATGDMIPTVTGLSTILSDILKDLIALGQSPSELTKARASVQQASNALTKLKTVTSSSIESRLASLPEAWKAIEDAIGFLDAGKVTSISTEYSSQRLKAHIVRPDCWFSSPPVCNVIFPEMYASLSFDRNFLQETTRLLVHSFDTLIGRDHLMANHILSPFIGFDATKLAKYKGAASFRILMDHEIHVGIVSKTEWIPNSAGISTDLDAEQLKKVSSGRLSWLIKASLYHFFKARFSARQVSINGRFNPSLVCGFPGAVITRPYYIDGGAAALRRAHGGTDVPDSDISGLIHEKAGEFNAPAHFVGLIGAIQHSIDQSGGTTSAVLHYARKHRGIDDEFIGYMVGMKENTGTRVLKYELEIEKALELASPTTTTPNIKPIALLMGVTPSKDEVEKPKKTAGKTSSVRPKVSSQEVSAASKDPKAQASAITAFVFSTNTESDTAGQDKVDEKPPRTHVGSISEANRTNVFIPFGSSASIKVNSKEGLFGGRIVGIEVPKGATLQTVAYGISGTVPVYVALTPTRDGTVYKFQTGSQTFKANKRGDAFTRVIIYEEVSFAVSGSLPIEEILRPSWFSTGYSSQRIGKQIYQPFFGCDAVVDNLVVSPDSAPPADDGSDPEPVDAATSAQDMMKRVSAAESQSRAISIEKSLNVLAYEYGQVKLHARDVESFIESYTKRPIATYRDIFGDAQLDFTINKKAVGGDAQVKKREDGTTPRVGFHTGATHSTLVDVGNLVGLATDLQLGFKRVDNLGASEPMVTQYDVRKPKKDRVRTYIADLTKGPGFVG
jgi:hypothetical protein